MEIVKIITVILTRFFDDQPLTKARDFTNDVFGLSKSKKSIKLTSYDRGVTIAHMCRLSMTHAVGVISVLFAMNGSDEHLKLFFL